MKQIVLPLIQQRRRSATGNTKNLSIMLSKIQVVENSDRFHVCENGVPEKTFMVDLYISREVANLSANSFAFKFALERQQDDFEIQLLPQEKK